MAVPFIGEVKLVAFGNIPIGWAPCDGRLLSIAQYPELFSLLGSLYGGDGMRTFALPDLRGRVPMHTTAQAPGRTGGSATHTLTVAELPSHSHIARASATPSHAADPTARTLGATEAGGINVMRPADGSATLHPAALESTGGGQAHENRQPYLATNFIIALVGIYPSRD
jgi:microcystin-dependent protein